MFLDPRSIGQRKSAAGPNGGGLLMGVSSFCRVEDNIVDFIYSFGYPNMGNGWSNGQTAQPSQVRYGADWERMLASEPGKEPGPSGFQELDLDVKATTLLKGNYNHKDNGVPESESLEGATLPKSLYLKDKPAVLIRMYRWPLRRNVAERSLSLRLARRRGTPRPCLPS